LANLCSVAHSNRKLSHKPVPLIGALPIRKVIVKRENYGCYRSIMTAGKVTNETRLKSRDIAPDVLRGFALLGILIVNIPYLALSSNGDAIHGGYLDGPANTLAGFLIFALFQGKFYLLFSFLFGYSSSYIIKGDKANRTRWIKRCLFLMTLGILHGTLLWFGEILFIYGLFGFALIPFFFRSEKVLKIWSRSIFALFASVLLIFASLLMLADRYLPEDDLSASFASERAEQLDRFMLNGTYVESMGARASYWLEALPSLVFLQGIVAFAAFLVGMRASRSNFLSLSTSEKSLSKMLKVGLLIGLPIQLLSATGWLINEQSSESSESIYLSLTLASMITAPLLSMGYLGAILAIIRKQPRLVAWMKPAGKVSLTTYISQSIAMLFIFAPWGLGLFQRVELWQLILIAVMIWLIQIFCATLWLKRFNLGPLEWVLNFLTKNR
jgi:uncharacterized protein